MTRKVLRSELLDYQSYDERRNHIRTEIMRVKAPRRIQLGQHLLFLFENTDTIRYQIQEMMRAEQIVKESAIQHELETYNGLLGAPGELGCALLISVDDPEDRRQKLRDWLPLPRHLYLKLDDGSKIYASYDEAQIGDDRLSAVQYLKFDTGGRRPVAIGSDFELLRQENDLSDEQRRALGSDLDEN